MMTAIKKLFFVFITFLFFGNLISQDRIPALPSTPTVVVDQLNMLSKEEKNELSQLILENENKTSNQILVYITNDINDLEPAEFCVQLGRKWGVGTQEFNNGVIVLIYKSEKRRIIWIATGYGLEGALPDITCKQIIENNIKPYFKEKRYYDGLKEGILSIIDASKGEYENTKAKVKKSGRGELIAFILFIIIMLIIILSKRGGGRGGGRRSSTMSDILMGAAIGSMLGRGGRSSGFGGGSGGGGFGGFGGGSFGGGGAGGSW